MSGNQSQRPIPPRRGPQNRPGSKPPPPRYKRGPFSYLIIAIVILTVMMMLQQWQRSEKIRLDEFVEHLDKGHIDSVVVKDTEVTGQFTEDYITGQEGESKKTFVVHFNPEVHGKWIGELLDESSIKQEAEP